MKKIFTLFLMFFVACSSSRKSQKIKPAFVVSDRYEGSYPHKDPKTKGIPFVEDIISNVGEYNFNLTLNEKIFLNNLFKKYSIESEGNNYVFPVLDCGAHILFSKLDTVQRIYIVMSPLYYFCILKDSDKIVLWLFYNEDHNGRIIGSGDDLLISSQPVETIQKIVSGKYKR